MPLTDVAVRTAKPASKPYKLTDGGGLFLLVQPSGGKWWRYKYRFGGKEKLLALGSYPDLSLAEARKFHAQARNVLALGNDPMEVKKEAKRQTSLKSDLSFEIVAKEWHQKQSRRWSAIHAKKTMRSLEADVFPKIGRRPIADISSSEMLTLLRKVESRGAIETAHRVMQNCSKVFSYAIATDRAERNPTTDLQGALETVRKKHNASLKEEQMPEFLSKLELYDKEYGGDLQTKLALKFLVLTFVRTIELRGAKWTEFHWDKAEWRIPAERMKMRDPHIVPLSKQTIKVLKELQELNGEWDLLFPNTRKPITFISENTILYALYGMGYRSKATGHGFRATASTILNENGFHPDVIERQLAHCERNKVRAAYNHAQYLPERRIMMQWWADHIDKLRDRQS